MFFTVKVTTPKVVLVLLAAEIVDELPDPCASATVLPDTKLSFASFSVTVTVELAVPSAAKSVGLAVTVDCPADTGPAV